MEKVKYYNSIAKVPDLERVDDELIKIEEQYKFRTNSYYNSLIDWSNPNDPLLNIIVPRKEEDMEWGELDASNETMYQPVKGLEHKYSPTALLLCNDVCGAYCRFCFRKRLFQNENDEVERDVSAGVKYIEEHPEISNVLLTGGDPLMMSNRRVREILSDLKQIDSVKIVRFGTKMLAFNPMRVDEEFLAIVKDFNEEKQVFVMVHYNHINELTKESIQAITALKEAGATILNQTPIIKGVNDDPEMIRELHDQLTYVGVVPYYVFACRPTKGNYTYAVPVEQAHDIYTEAIRRSSGIGKNARFIMSHHSGKCEVVGKTDTTIIFKKHNIVHHENNGGIMMAERNPSAYWLDDYTFTPQ